MIKTEFIKLYEDLNTLNEDGLGYYSRPNYSKDFWDKVKENKIDDNSFRSAYKDELTKLGLTDLLEPDPRKAEGRVLKEKGSYGRIKKAAEENPNSWAAKALLKIWVLQFKNDVKAESWISAEEYRLRRETEEKEKAENLAKYEAVLPQVVPVVNKVGLDFAKKHIKDLEDRVTLIKNLKDEIDSLSRDTISTTSLYTIDVTNLSDDKLFEAEFKALPQGIIVELKTLLNCGIKSSYNHGKLPTSIILKLEDIESNKTESILLELLESLLPGAIIDGAGYTSDYTIKEYQQELVDLKHRIAESRKAKAAVDAGKPVDPDFIATILAAFKEGTKEASSAYDFYSDTTDGSAGAAYEGSVNYTITRIAPYFFYCSWRSYVGEREIAKWYTTESTEDLLKALRSTFNAVCADLNIEILKD